MKKLTSAEWRTQQAAASFLLLQLLSFSFSGCRLPYFFSSFGLLKRLRPCSFLFSICLLGLGLLILNISHTKKNTYNQKLIKAHPRRTLPEAQGAPRRAPLLGRPPEGVQGTQACALLHSCEVQKLIS